MVAPTTLIIVVAVLLLTLFSCAVAMEMSLKSTSTRSKQQVLTKYTPLEKENRLLNPPLLVPYSLGYYKYDWPTSSDFSDICASVTLLQPSFMVTQVTTIVNKAQTSVWLEIPNHHTDKLLIYVPTETQLRLEAETLVGPVCYYSPTPTLWVKGSRFVVFYVRKPF